MTMAVSSSTVLKVRGLPSNRNTDEVTSLPEHSLQIRPEARGLSSYFEVPQEAPATFDPIHYNSLVHQRFRSNLQFRK